MGLGKEGDLGWTGYEGMSRWMVRPLLSIRKVCLHFISLNCFSSNKFRKKSWRHVKRLNYLTCKIRLISSRK